MTKHIENIVIGIPIVPCGVLLSDGTTTDMMNEVDKTYFTNNHNVAHILKELGIVSSLSDDANLLKYINRSAYTLSTMHCTDTQLLDGGDNCILCENCMEDFEVFMGNK
jgi:hypothetical protein